MPSIVHVVIATALVLAGAPAHASSSDVFRLEVAAKLNDFDTYDSIAERRGDFVLFDAGGTWWPQYVTFVLSQSYDQRQKLVALIKEAFQIEEVREGAASPKPPTSRNWENPPANGPASTDFERGIQAREKRLRDAGIRPVGYRHTELDSAPMNGSVNDGVFSRVFFRIVDARDVFARDCSLVIVTRVDKTKEWARIAHTPVVLPYRVTSTTRLVTKSEFEGARSVLQKNGAGFAGPVLTSAPLEPMRSTETLLMLKDKLDAICPGTSIRSGK